ncbi:MAG: hypothetical protein AAFO99_09780 [Bacteroidota bacterium]
MIISHDEARIICCKAQYGEASLWERLKLKLHITFSKNTAEFSKKNTKLSTLCDNAYLQGLTEKEKQAMKEKLKENN